MTDAAASGAADEGWSDTAPPDDATAVSPSRRPAPVDDDTVLSRRTPPADDDTVVSRSRTAENDTAISQRATPVEDDTVVVRRPTVADTAVSARRRAEEGDTSDRVDDAREAPDAMVTTVPGRGEQPRYRIRRAPGTRPAPPQTGPAVVPDGAALDRARRRLGARRLIVIAVVAASVVLLSAALLAVLLPGL